jgi:hypothetical protein
MTQILAQFDVKGYSSPQYRKTVNDLTAAGLAHPKGRLYNIAVQNSKGKGMTVTVGWESEKELDEFSKTIVPILEKNGVTKFKPVLLPGYYILQ